MNKKISFGTFAFSVLTLTAAFLFTACPDLFGNQTQTNVYTGKNTGSSETEPSDAASDEFIKALLDELNFARTQPQKYVLERLEHTNYGFVETNEFLTNLQSLKEEMNAMSPVNALTLQAGGLSKAAKEWCTIQGLHKQCNSKDWVGHEGDDDCLPQSTRTFSERVNQYGSGSNLSEDIVYGDFGFGYRKTEYDAQKAIISLLVDEGVEDLGHRKSLLGKIAPHNCVGIGYGPHNWWGGMIVFELCYDFTEHAFVENKPKLTPPNDYSDADPIFVVYDDNLTFKDSIPQTSNPAFPEKTKIGNWYVMIREGENKVYFYENDEKSTYPSAVFDAEFQYWEFMNGHFTSTTYEYPWYVNTKHFDDDPKTILSQIIESVDSSIDLTRGGYDFKQQYNLVFIPLSNKNAEISRIENYKWKEDADFKAFADWMDANDVPENKKNFYKKMAQFPYQRGCVRDYNNPALNEKENRWYAGADAGWVGTNLFAGGMQKFFEFRKTADRKLFNNSRVPVLLVHIIDSDENAAASDLTKPLDMDAEKVRVEKAFSNSELPCAFDVYVADIKMSYTKYVSDMKVENSVEYDQMWDEIVALVEEKYPSFVGKFTDKNKSAIIRYFDTYDMNNRFGTANAISGWNFYVIMIDIGYGVTHLDIWGSEEKTQDAVCVGSDCAHPDNVCPLCQYAFGIGK